MRSALALALLLLAVVALLAKQLLAFCLLAPAAVWAMRKARETPDNLEGLMGVCFTVALVFAAIEYGGALLP